MDTYVQTCLVEVTRSITYCGMHSHSSILRRGLYTYVHTAGRDGCKSIHQYQECRGFDGQIISRVWPNSTISTTVTLAGGLSIGGTCQGTILGKWSLMGSRHSHREDNSARLLSHFKTRTERNHTERRSHLFISKQILHRHNNLRIGVEFYRTSKVRHRSHTIDWRRPPSLSKKLISTNQIHRLGSRRQNIRPILVKTGRRQNNNRKNICSHYLQTMLTYLISSITKGRNGYVGKIAGEVLYIS